MKYDWESRVGITVMWSTILGIDLETEKGKEDFETLTDLLRDSDWPIPPESIVRFAEKIHRV